MDKTRDTRIRARTLEKSLPANPRLFAHLADCYLDLGRLKDAEKLLSRGVQQHLDYPLGWVVQGKLFLGKLEPERAQEAFQMALKLDPDLSYPHEQLGELADREGDDATYIHHLRELSRLNPLDDNIQLILDTAILRKIAVENGLYTREDVERVMPGVLRQRLLANNLLPLEYERRSQRPHAPEVATRVVAERDVAPAEEYKPPGLEESLFESDEEIIVVGEQPQEPESFEALKPEEVGETLESPYPPTEEQPMTRVSWAEAVAPEGEEPAIRPVEPAPEEAEEGKGAPEADTEPSAERVPEGGEVTPEEGEPGREGLREPRESPIMRLLRGEMMERKVSKELTFVREESAEEAEVTEEEGSKEEVAYEPGRLEMESTIDMISPPAEAQIEGRPAPEETGKPPGETETAPGRPEVEAEPQRGEAEGEAAPVERREPGLMPEADVPEEHTEKVLPVSIEPAAEPEAAPTPEGGKEEDEPHRHLAQIAREVTATGKEEEPQQSWRVGGPQEKIATKTLAELHVSQGELAKAIDVYRELLRKFPTNQSYRVRMEELQGRLESGGR